MSERANVCDFYGCTNPIAPDEKQFETGMRFCEKHQTQVSGLIKEMNIKGLLSFWVKASGGTARMVRTPAGVYQSHEMARKAKGGKDA